MSHEATNWALYVPVGGNAKVILLGLANHAHPDGTEAYPALDTLAEYANCDRSTARRNVRKLVADGWAIEDGHGPRGQVKYRLPIDREISRGSKTPRVAPAPPGGGTSAPEGVAPVPPEPSTEPPTNRSIERAGTVKVRYDGQVVPSHIVTDAESLLALFNEVAGRKLTSRKASGQPSEHLRQVIGALLANPEATFEEWEVGVRRVVAEPPSWTNGAPAQLGDIFGPKAAARTLTPPGPVLNGHGRKPSHAELVAELDAANPRLQGHQAAPIRQLSERTNT